MTSDAPAGNGGTPIRLVYVSYDGALDPLGSSQVVPYLLALAARKVAIRLVSFEKPARWRDTSLRERMAHVLAAGNIAWEPLRYHKSPRAAATLFDVARGAVSLGRMLRQGGADVVQARGEVAMTMARWAARPPGVRLVLESRGLFSDERTEVGSWRKGGLVDRVVRHMESANLRAANGLLLVMSPAGVDAYRRKRQPLPPHEAMPNCVDLSRFTPRGARDRTDYGLVYSGSLGGWYMTREMVDFGREAALRFKLKTLFLTPDPELARRAGADASWADVRSARPEEVPAWLRRARAGFLFVAPTPAKRASSPTKVAEALATGLPIVANQGVGDLDYVLEPSDVGVLVRDHSASGYGQALDRLGRLLDDPGASARCRRLAERSYSLETAVARYLALYNRILRREGQT